MPPCHIGPLPSMTDFWKSFPDHACREALITHLTTRYNRLKVFPIGRSILGREIPALCIGNPVGATLFVGATHGSEWLTSLLLLRFFADILHALHMGGTYSDIDVRKALQTRSIVLVPCLNPDGVEIALHGAQSAGGLAEQVERLGAGRLDDWQANAGGVDLNHNFDAGWPALRELERGAGIHGPGPTRYGGPHPHSEPESAAIVTFCQTHHPRTLYSFHSQGEEIYYQYGEHTPTRSRMIAQILASSSGYSIARPAKLASHGGLKDWFIEKFRRPGFTIEVGLGKNPLGLELLELIYSQIEEMLILAALL